MRYTFLFTDWNWNAKRSKQGVKHPRWGERFTFFVEGKHTGKGQHAHGAKRLACKIS